MNILLIAYYFPPDSSSGSFRPLIFARELQKIGETVHVLTAREQDYLPEQPTDHKLQEETEQFHVCYSRVFRPREWMLQVRNRLFNRSQHTGDAEQATSRPNDFNKAHSKSSSFQQLKDAVTDFLSMPDPQIGWLPAAVAAGRKIVKQHDIDVIYVTAGPWTGLLIGSLLKKLTGKPLVMDFRDPWVANPYFLVRGKFFRKIESSLERAVLHAADHVIANTEELKQDFLSRYPRLTPDTVTHIPNGFEAYLPYHEAATPKLTFTHAGALYFSRNPIHMLQATLNLIQKGIIPQDDIQIVLLGGVSISDPKIDALLCHPLLEGVVECTPRLPYQETIQYQHDSHVLLLIQPDFPLQIPRKLYEYMAFQKPMLAITEAEGATAKLITKYQLGLVAQNQTASIEQALQTFYRRWKQGDWQLGLTAQNHVMPDSDARMPSKRSCDDFLNTRLTQQLFHIFQHLAC